MRSAFWHPDANAAEQEYYFITLVKDDEEEEEERGRIFYDLEGSCHRCPFFFSFSHCFIDRETVCVALHCFMNKLRVIHILRVLNEKLDKNL